MGGTSYEDGYHIAVDTNGNVYTTGSFGGTVDFDSGPGTFNLTSASTGGADVFVSKLDGNGNFVWAKRMGGTGDEESYGISVDSNSNIYTTGYFYGTADFNPGAGTFNLNSAGNVDIFVSKLDGNGNFIWAKSMGGIDNDRGKSIALDSIGNVYTTGIFSYSADFDPGPGIFDITVVGRGEIFVSKLDNNGSFVWAKNMGGPVDDYSSSITLDSYDNVYTTGHFQGIADFDPGSGTFNLTGAGGGDIFVSKLDSNGNFIWAKNMVGTSYDGGNSIAVDSSGNVYTTGEFYKTVDFDPGSSTFYLTSTLFLDIFISKLDSDGNFVWAKSMGGANDDSSSSIVLDSSSNIYTTGIFRSTVDFDPGLGTFNLTSAGASNIFVSKLDSNGNFIWAKSMGGTGGAIGHSVALDSISNIYITGGFSGTADFDPGPDASNLVSVGGTDIFISKLQAAEILYVTPGGTGDCSTWANACDLQTALTAASSGDEVWVAAGTYKPTTDTDRTSSFQLKDGVAVYGGFTGTESALDERDPAANVTILSGDLNGDDSNNIAYDEPTRADNSYHVVSGATGATLNGFTVTAGNANGSGSCPGIGCGGGLLNTSDSSPVLTNITFSGNSADYGGGMYNLSSSPMLTNVTFNSNFAGSYGGGMFNDSGSSPTLTNLTFNGNSATTGGGGMSNYDSSSPQIRNTIFWGNTAATEAEIYNNNSIPGVSDSVIQGGYAGGTNIITADPLLGTLGDYGGYTDTIPLLPGSSAINAGNDTICPATDQRGVTRPQGSSCDTGSYEYNVNVYLPLILR